MPFKNSATIYLVFSDVFAVIAAFLVSYHMRDAAFFRSYLDNVQPIGAYLTALPFALLLFLAILGLLGLYDKRTYTNHFSEFHGIIRAIILWQLVIMAGSYLYKYDYSRLVVLLFGFFTFCILTLGRVFFRVVLAKRLQNGAGNRIALIVGTGEHAEAIAGQLLKLASSGIRLAGFLGERSGVKINGIEVLGGYDDLFRIMSTHSVHDVYIADKNISGEHILSMISMCPHPLVRFKVATSLFDRALNPYANLYDIDDIRSKPDKFSTALKRACDVALSVGGLFITLPFWPFIFLAVRIDSPGAPLLSQERVGLGGKKFKMYKFRTMKSDTEFYAPAPRQKTDARITRVGRFLRKTSLDELPQLINILKGEMSVVGPRPEMPFIVERYAPWQKKRLEVKPGLTGLWQILGRKDLPLEENLHYDFYYINNQSFLLDITIILKTIPYVLFGKGAY